MLFTEPTFLFLFLPTLVVLYYLPWQRHRNWLLVVASVVFYSRGAGAFTTFILASIAFNYVAARAIDRLHGSRAAWYLLCVTVSLNLLALGVLKYAAFIVTNVNGIAASVGLGAVPAPAILLPIGISFFTFHAVSYVVDVYRRDAIAQKHPVEAALYLLLFPQLVAGPIIRYREIAAQLTARVHRIEDVAYGLRRFIIGLAKKMLIANIVAVPVDQIFAMPAGELTAAHAWIATVCYTLQIYFDFSGYSDMAIGLGRIFGFRFPENFRYPYVATSMQDFWRRWHITLSAWFRDYLYVPLGGNRQGAGRLYVNLLTVFFLCGLWHGASWTFVSWGLLHGFFLVLERVGLARVLERVPRPARHAYVLGVTMLTWVLFRADSFVEALAMMRAMVGLGAGVPTIYAAAWYLTPELLVAVGAGVIGATPLLRLLDARDGAPSGWFGAAITHVALLAMLVVSVMLIAAHAYNPFIYFRF